FDLVRLPAHDGLDVGPQLVGRDHGALERLVRVGRRDGEGHGGPRRRLALGGGLGIGHEDAPSAAAAPRSRNVAAHRPVTRHVPRGVLSPLTARNTPPDRAARAWYGRRAVAAVDYFLKIDGIQGESVDKAHKGEIQLESFSWGEVTPNLGPGSHTG